MLALAGACDGSAKPEPAAKTQDAPPTTATPPTPAAPTPDTPTPAAPTTAAPPTAATPPTTATPPPASDVAADTGRPKTMEAALARLDRLARAGDAAGLLALADAGKGLEHRYTGTSKRPKTTKIRVDQPDKFAAALKRTPGDPLHYIDTFFHDLPDDGATLKLGAREGVVEGLGDGSYGVDFVFTRDGEAFVLVAIETWDQDV